MKIALNTYYLSAEKLENKNVYTEILGVYYLIAYFEGVNEVMSYNFEGKVAIVSGGASGIGAETVKLLIEGGAAVVIADIDLEKATEFADELNANGGKAAPFKANVANPEDSKATVEFAKETFGSLHLAFNNAGIVGAEKHVDKLTPEE